MKAISRTLSASAAIFLDFLVTVTLIWLVFTWDSRDTHPCSSMVPRPRSIRQFLVSLLATHTKNAPALALLALLPAVGAMPCPQQPPQPSAPQAARQQWKTVPFAIVRYNDDAPKSWNVYHGEKKGVYLVRLWKRYLVVDTAQQAAFEIDPAKVKVEGDNAELSPADIPADPIETSEWKSRDAGPVLRHRFRFGATGNFMELQIPLQLNGKPAY